MRAGYGDGSCTPIITTYTYDAANRLIAATNGLTTTSFVYNGLGDRVNKVIAGVTTTYTLDLAARADPCLGSMCLAGISGTNAEYSLSDGLGAAVV